MDVKGRQAVKAESGQSLLEFLLLLPMMLGLTFMMIKVNTIIQAGIVDQQYSRAQTLWLAFNSNTYPQIRLREKQMVKNNYNQMTLGVSDTTVAADESGTIDPVATVVNISRPGGPQGDDNPKEEPTARTKVRARNTVTMCTQPVVVKTNTGYQPLLPLARGPGGDDSFVAAGTWALAEGNIKYDYCHGETAQ